MLGKEATEFGQCVLGEETLSDSGYFTPEREGCPRELNDFERDSCCDLMNSLLQEDMEFQKTTQLAEQDVSQ